MNNFRFTKIIAGVSPTLAKETVLSKVINMVDAFRITLSKGYDDNNKKYIDTLMKLDNSKTVILETKGNDVRIKNTGDLTVKKGETWTAEYSEYAQEGSAKIYIDYPDLGELKEGTILECKQSNVSLKIKSTKDDTAEVEVLDAGKGKIIQYDRILFEGLNEIDEEELSERDKKDILWGLEYGSHVLGVSCASSAEHIKSAREFLENNNAKEMKVFAKIETITWMKNLDEIIEAADGIIFAIDAFPSLKKENIIETIRKIKQKGKPVLITKVITLTVSTGGSEVELEDYVRLKYKLNTPSLITKVTTCYGKDFEESFWKEIQEYSKEAVDGIMLETFLVEEEVFEAIEKTWNLLSDVENKLNEKALERFEKEGDFEVRDYIIYNAFRSGTELWVKTAICFTDNGYTASRFASLAPRIPVITFTQSKETYRYLSLVWWVKGYKISQSFNYENLKKIGKEMVRMIFKWNISLDDKILILQANETIDNDKGDMINGIELYNFKNI